LLVSLTVAVGAFVVGFVETTLRHSGRVDSSQERCQAYGLVSNGVGLGTPIARFSGTVLLTTELLAPLGA
jgi:hypothetical protein